MHRYGNSNEDVSMGKWVHYVEDKHHSVEHITGHFARMIGVRFGSNVFVHIGSAHTYVSFVCRLDRRGHHASEKCC